LRLFITDQYNVSVEVSKQGHNNGRMEPFIMVQYNGSEEVSKQG
jgi:hypothetical protein